MSFRSVVAGAFLVLATIGCSVAPRPNPATGTPAQRDVPKEVCDHDSDCAPYWHCTSDHRCRCQIDSDCAATQQCRAGVCRYR